MKEYEKKWLCQLNKIIDSNLDNPNFQLLTITTELGISRAKLYRIIVKLTGFSPNTYIRKARLKKAREILEARVYPTVKQTAAVVGIRRAGYFSKIFFEEHNILPSQYLKG